MGIVLLPRRLSSFIRACACALYMRSRCGSRIMVFRRVVRPCCRVAVMKSQNATDAGMPERFRVRSCERYAR